MQKREEARQRAHYEQLAPRYEASYGDRWSREYRGRFVHGPMTAGVPLEGACILEAMCGSGQLAEYLVARGANVTGIDVASAEIDLFRQRLPGSTAIVGSILDTGLPNETFDAVMVVGALHHVHPYVEQAVDEIHRILRPGGFFCFLEPHVGSLPNAIRRLWYRLDPLFEDNEAAIDLDHLMDHKRHRFEFVTTSYSGSLAFLLVYNSLVFRVPATVKRIYAPLLLRLEALIERVQTKRSSCIVICQWRKLS
jgi:SAM-dependent methyltransferase